MNNDNIILELDVNKIDNILNTTNCTPIEIITDKINENVSKIIDKIKKGELSKSFYIGNLNNSEIKGEGLYITKNKLLIEGEFNTLNDIKTSYCNYNNCILSGNIIDWEFISGTYLKKNIKIIGNFTNGLPCSTIKYFSGSVLYEGECIDGKMNGLGFYKDPDITYEGEWLNNQFNGEGVFKDRNIKYSGFFKNGKKHGEGKLTVNENDYFVEFDNDKEIIRIDYNQKTVNDLENKVKNLQDNVRDNTYIIKEQEKQIIQYNQKIKSIENEKKVLEDQFNCKICFKNVPNIVLNPCHHCAICEICETNISRMHNGRICPICRKPYKSITKIFI